MTQWLAYDLNNLRSGIAAVIFLLLIAGTAQAEPLPGPLVDVDWLESNLDKVTLLDVRADVNSFHKRSKGGSPVNPCGAGIKGKEVEPVAGHIPGAVLVRWSLLTTQRSVTGKKTDGWLPEGADFERLMQKSGVKQDSKIVITYKGEKAIESAMAARLLFTLKYFGHDAVALLNGGTAAWMQSGRKVKFGRSKSKRGDFLAKQERTEMVAALADVKAISESGTGQLLDVRQPAGYFGVASKFAAVDPQWYGHIPRASNLPMTMLSNDLGPAALLFDIDTLQQILALMGTKPDAPSVVYCNSGIMASLGWFVLSELLGNTKVSLYDGSMQEWSLNKMPVVAMQRD
jgi:thiosulfate/3-mercaptopyruvate sulfurtransferase